MHAGHVDVAKRFTDSRHMHPSYIAKLGKTNSGNNKLESLPSSSAQWRLAPRSSNISMRTPPEAL